MVPQGQYYRFVPCCNGAPLTYSSIHVVTNKICLTLGGHRNRKSKVECGHGQGDFHGTYMPTCLHALEIVLVMGGELVGGNNLLNRRDRQFRRSRASLSPTR